LDYDFCELSSLQIFQSVTLAVCK